MRREHIALPDLYDSVCGGAVMDAKAKRHIEECEQCQHDVSWLRSLAEFGAAEKKFDPPLWATLSAQKFLQLRKPGIVSIAKEIVASLVYDSFNEPLPAGIRSRETLSRQALYSTENLQLDLKIELGAKQGLIIGQLMTEKSGVDIQGLQIELTQSGLVIGKSMTNALGEFIFQDVPKGDYELQINMSDTMVKLPPLPRTNC